MSLKLFFLLLIFFFIPFLILAVEKININTASLEELQKLTGVGPVIGQRIIEERPFSSIEDLIRVKGIGPKKLEDIKKQGLAWIGDTLNETTQAPRISENSSFQTRATKIDINEAPLEELVRIIHIGEIRARQLISLRPFYSLDDLREIKGIGEKSLEDIKKQGLAWVDPSFEKLRSKTIPKSNFLDKEGVASVIESQNSKSLNLFLTALSIAILSGFVILAIKTKFLAKR